MKPYEVKVCILRIEGTNCEQEMFDAFAGLGADPELVHLNQLTNGKVAKGGRRDLHAYHVLVIPGGFSAGDYVRAGAIFAARLRSALGKDLLRFAEEGRPIGGVCNGFQVLVELGMLPAAKQAMAPHPEAVLMTNDSARFECRPVLVKHESKGKCVWTSRVRKDTVLNLPVAHMEGRFVLPDASQYDDLFSNDQVVFRYVDPAGKYAGYPWNPNGSPHNIAGVASASGTVFGLMPHPERVFHGWQHPDWTRGRSPESDGDGHAVFESVIDHVTRRF